MQLKAGYEIYTPTPEPVDQAAEILLFGNDSEIDVIFEEDNSFVGLGRIDSHAALASFNQKDSLDAEEHADTSTQVHSDAGGEQVLADFRSLPPMRLEDGDSLASTVSSPVADSTEQGKPSAPYGSSLAASSRANIIPFPNIQYRGLQTAHDEQRKATSAPVCGNLPAGQTSMNNPGGVQGNEETRSPLALHCQRALNINLSWLMKAISDDHTLFALKITVEAYISRRPVQGSMYHFFYETHCFMDHVEYLMGNRVQSFFQVISFLVWTKLFADRTVDLTLVQAAAIYGPLRARIHDYRVCASEFLMPWATAQQALEILKRTSPESIINDLVEGIEMRQAK